MGAQWLCFFPVLHCSVLLLHKLLTYGSKDYPTWQQGGNVLSTSTCDLEETQLVAFLVIKYMSVKLK